MQFSICLTALLHNINHAVIHIKMLENPARKVSSIEELERLVVGEVVEHKIDNDAEFSLGNIVYAGIERRGSDKFFIFIKRGDFQRNGQVVRCIIEYAVDKDDADESYFNNGCLSFFEELSNSDCICQGDERFKRYDELLKLQNSTNGILTVLKNHKKCGGRFLTT